MKLITSRQANSRKRFLLWAVALILTCSLSVLGQMVFFSTRTGSISSATQADAQWSVLANGRWQVNPHNPKVIVSNDHDNNYTLSLNGGSTFERVAAPFDVAAPAAQFHFDAANSSLLFAQSGSQLKVSSDLGSTWTSIALPSSLPGTDSDPLLFVERNSGEPQIMIARGKQVWEAAYNSDAPIWALSLDAATDVTAMAVNDEQSVVVAGTKEGFIHVRNSFDGDARWFATFIRSAPVSAIAFDHLDDGRFAVGFAEAPTNSSEGLVYVTYNGGLSLTPIFSLPGTSVRDLAFVVDNENHVRLYSVASNVFVTTDLLTWYQEAGLEGRSVTKIDEVATGGVTQLVGTGVNEMYGVTLPAMACGTEPAPAFAEVPLSGGNVELPIPSGCPAAVQKLGQYPVRVGDVSTDGKSILLAIDANQSREERNLYVNVGQQKIALHQAAAQTRPADLKAAAATATCAVLSITPAKVGKGGGKVAIVFRKTSACGPVVVDTPEPLWISTGLAVLTKAETSTVSITVNANTGTARSGSITFIPSSGKVSGAPAKITQDAGSTCNGATATMSTNYFGPSATTATLTLKLSGSCPGLALKSSAPWVVLKSSGSNKYSVQIAANTGSSRNGVITVSDSTHPELAEVLISQEGVPGSSGGPGVVAPPNGCTGIKAALSTNTFAIGGGSATLTITPSGTCTYTITSTAFITVKQSSTNTKAITVASNSGNPARHGTIQVSTAGNAFSAQVAVDQAGVTSSPATCTGITPTLSPTNVVAAGGSANLTLKTVGNCINPTVVSGSNWMTVSPNGTNAYRIVVSANTSTQARSGKLTINAGPAPGFTATATVQQAAPETCTFRVSPTTLSFKWSGGASNETITTNLSTCAWTAGPIQSNFGSTTWVHLNQTQGAGTQVITVSVDSDADSSISVNNVQGRSATFTLAGVTVTVNQDPLLPGTCNPSGPGGANIQLGINTNSFSGAGGQATITVNAPNGCMWNLSFDSGSWLQFVNGRSGTGNGKVLVNILPNTASEARSGRVTADQATPDLQGNIAHVTITQQGTR